MRRRPVSRASTSRRATHQRRALMTAVASSMLLMVALATLMAPTATRGRHCAPPAAGGGPEARAQQPPTTVDPGTAEPLAPATTESQPATTAPTTSSTTAPTTTRRRPGWFGGSRRTRPRHLFPPRGPMDRRPRCRVGPPPGFTEEQYRTFISVVEACGPDPGVVCERLYDWTGNRTLAEATQWFVSVPVAAGLVVLLALIANWLVRRAIDR